VSNSPEKCKIHVQIETRPAASATVEPAGHFPDRRHRGGSRSGGDPLRSILGAMQGTNDADQSR
jgi:hypothetical protein